MFEKPIIIRLDDGQTADFNETQVADAVKFFLNNGGSIEVSGVDITTVVNELQSEQQNVAAGHSQTMTVEEVVEELSVSKRRVFALASSDMIKRVHAGLYDADSVRAYKAKRGKKGRNIRQIAKNIKN